MFRSFLYGLGLILPACSLAPISGGAPDGECQAYALVLEDLARPQGRLVVLVDSTIPSPTFNPFFGGITDRLPSLSLETIEAFRRQNSAVTRVPDCPFATPVQRVAPAELDRIVRRGGQLSYWDAFYEHFPGSVGRVNLSRVGFSSTGDQGLLYAGWACGFLCARSTYFLLRRQGSEWVIERQYTMVVS